MSLTNIDPNLTSQMADNLTYAFISTMNNGINLTGNINATLLQPAIWYTAAISALAIVFSGIMGGFIALYGVKKTLRHNNELVERNRIEDARKRSREERKKAYIRFTAFMNNLYLMNNISTKDLATNNLNKIIIQYSQYWSEIQLINPQIAIHIGRLIVSLKGSTTDTVTEIVNDVCRQYNTSILPLMQADLSSLSSPEDNPNTGRSGIRWISRLKQLLRKEDTQPTK